MFYVLSKLFWIAVQPLNLLLGLMLVAVLALALRRTRLSAIFLALGILLLVVGGLSSTGTLILAYLEAQHPRPAPPAEIAGIVILGGGFDTIVSGARGNTELGGAGDRFVEGLALAGEYPDAKIIVSGGVGALSGRGEGDASIARRFFDRFSVASERLIFETRSRNTHQNALFSKELASPMPGETWLLVTSAFHMPRAMGSFSSAGFAVTPWPVDFKTTGAESLGFDIENPDGNLDRFSIALRECIGLLAYWLTGKTPALLP